MSAWWEALTTFQQVFVCVAIPSTLLMVVQFILTMIGIGGGGADADSDVDLDMDGDGEINLDDIADGDEIFDANASEEAFNFGLVFRLFTLRGLIAFLAVMGWTGYALDGSGLPRVAVIFISIAAGFAMMVILALLFRFFQKFQADGNLNIRNALGQSGTVYLTVPAGRGGIGKVNLVVQEKLGEFEAVTDESEPLPFGTEVVVIAISGADTLVVKRK